MVVSYKFRKRKAVVFSFTFFAVLSVFFLKGVFIFDMTSTSVYAAFGKHKQIVFLSEKDFYLEANKEISLRLEKPTEIRGQEAYLCFLVGSGTMKDVDDKTKQVLGSMYVNRHQILNGEIVSKSGDVYGLNKTISSVWDYSGSSGAEDIGDISLCTQVDITNNKPEQVTSFYIDVVNLTFLASIEVNAIYLKTYEKNEKYKISRSEEPLQFSPKSLYLDLLKTFPSKDIPKQELLSLSSLAVINNTNFQNWRKDKDKTEFLEKNMLISESITGVSLGVSDNDLYIVPNEIDYAISKSIKIPKSSVYSCSARCSRSTLLYTVLAIPEPSYSIEVEPRDEIVGWCWKSGLPILSEKDVMAWRYGESPLPAFAENADYFSSLESYKHRMSQVCQITQ